MSANTQDTELLKLAAKGAGLVRDGINYAHPEWNPRDNDADAFLLAVKLKMVINIKECAVYVFGCDCSGYPREANEKTWPDAALATRLAITKVAAEIGKYFHE